MNADLIASGISPLAHDNVAIEAGRIMKRRIDELCHLRQDFSIETTLSGRWLIKEIRVWRNAGYDIELYYLALGSPDHAVARVKMRISKGGHPIPEETIRRRFARSLNLLEHTYKGLVDRWVVMNNSDVSQIEIERGGNW